MATVTGKKRQCLKCSQLFLPTKERWFTCAGCFSKSSSTRVMSSITDPGASKGKKSVGRE